MKDRPVAILTSGDYIAQNAVNAMTAETENDGIHMTGDHRPQTGEHSLCCVVRPITVPTSSQAAMLVSCRDVGLMMIETHRSVGCTLIFHVCARPHGDPARQAVLRLFGKVDCKAVEFAEIHDCPISI